jgi:hypothetical protein
MTPQELLELATKSTSDQIDLNHRMVENHLDETDRISARQTAEAISAASLSLISNPTT